MKTCRIPLDNAFEADWIDGILTEEGIPHVVASHATLPYNGLFQIAEGWGHLEIPLEFRLKAEKLLQDFKRSLNENARAGIISGNVHKIASGRHLRCRLPGSAAWRSGKRRMDREELTMFDQDKIEAIMNQTGADRETARAALHTSDGNVDIAVRIIRSYTLKGEAGAQGSAWAGSAGSGAPGPDADTGTAGWSEPGGSASGEAGTEAGSEAGTGQSEERKADSRIPRAQDIMDSIRDIWKKGNASRLDIEKNGRVMLSISLTIGTIGLVLAPVAALIGLGAALITEYTIKITLDNGTVINVNEFAIMRRRTTETKEPREPKE